MKRKFKYNRKGTTLIELSFVTGIAAMLLAMILGLARHVTRVSNISKAKTVLAAWHLAMDNWHQTFGEYPGDIIREDGSRESPLDENILGNLSNVYYQASQFLYDESSLAEVKFGNYCTQPIKVFDPWGTPYIYLRDESRQSYELYSCGPDADTEEIELEPGRTRTHNTSFDDIYFGR